MTPTDATQDHQLRCRSHLLRLWTAARTEAGTLPLQVVAEVAEAVAAIIAEAEAAGRDVGAIVVEGRGSMEAGMFLRVRLDRLTVAADDVIAAARAGNLAEMRRHLHRFDALVAAIWMVQEAVYAPPLAQRRTRHPV
jgi:hypothetical protein